MVFNSLHFLIFLPIVLGIYSVLNQKSRLYFLLIASYYFYMSWKAEYVILILSSTIINYIAAIYIDKHRDKYISKLWLTLGLVTSLGILFVFKYLNFFTQSIGGLFDLQVNRFNLLLPVGISFYTFQTLSYTIDVYRQKTKVEKNFFIFALYVSFFPQLVAGPIERSDRLLPQFYQDHSFKYNKFVNGLRMLLWGMFKKVVVADRLAIYVDSVYNNVPNHSGFTLLVATYFFAFQIYCDFSGYSDIAIGTAKMFGYNLMTNFKTPYFSKTLKEFWSRWHISLSTWFRDYFYIPIGGNRCSKLRQNFNLLATFLVSGLWHGASWTFVIWGAIHGLYQIFEKYTANFFREIARITRIDRIKYLQNLISIVVIFNIVCFAWIFFRANSVADSFLIIKKIFTEINLSNLFIDGKVILFSVISIAVTLFYDILSYNIGFAGFIQKHKIIYRWGTYLFLSFLIMTIGVLDESQFIYFQF